MKDLVSSMRKGDRRALSRLLSYVEERDERAFKLLEEIWSLTGNVYTIGVTGPAGAGKSTLIDQIITRARSKGKKVGVVAVDPSSPFTGGAVLGDRIRMQKHSGDPDVFIRSVSSAGRSGGVSFSTRALVQLLDAAGMDLVIVETVGAGQSEVDIIDIVDTVVVVLVPESGDSIQALKAGLLEIADVFVVNKKDRDGADRVAREIETMLSLAPNKDTWVPPVLLTEAVGGEGVDEVWQAVERHRAEINSKGIDSKEKLRRRLHELCEILEARLSTEIFKGIQQDRAVMSSLEDDKKPNLYAVADDWLRKSNFTNSRR